MSAALDASGKSCVRECAVLDRLKIEHDEI